MTNLEIISKARNLINEAHKQDFTLENINNKVDELLPKFNWLNANKQEIQQFSNICEDLFSIHGYLFDNIIKILISQLKLRTDNSNDSADDDLVILGPFQFRDKESLRYKIRSIIHNTEDNSFLEGYELELVKELLNFHPRAADKLEGFEGIYVSHHKHLQFQNTRTFFISKNNGTFSEDFSYIRCLEKLVAKDDLARIEICKNIKRAFELFPSCIDSLVTFLSDTYPHSRSSIDSLIGFTRATLWLAKNITVVRQKIMRLIITQLTQMDAEIKFVDPNSIDLEQMEIWKKDQLKMLAQEIQRDTLENKRISEILGNPNWFREVYMKIRSEEDIDQIAHKLDSLMCIIFDYIESELREMEPIQADEHLSKLHFNASEIESASESTYEANSNTLSTTNQSLVDNNCWNRSNLSISMADVFVAELYDIFDQVVLQTHKSKYVQFIFFYVANQKPFWSQKFLKRLFETVYNPYKPILERRLCVAYISSFICRSQLIPQNFVTSSFNFLLQFLNEYLSYWKSSTKSKKNNASDVPLEDLATQSSFLNPESHLSLFYTISQFLCYIFCYLGKRLITDKIGSDLFATGTDSFIEILKSDLKPLSNCKPSILRQFLSSCRKHSQLQPFEDFFLEQELITQNIKSSNLTWIFDPLESIFPFDPYRLRHSFRFIRAKYRDWSSEHDLTEVSYISSKYKSRNSVESHTNSSLIQPTKIDTESLLDLEESKLDEVQDIVQDSMGFSAFYREMTSSNPSNEKRSSIQDHETLSNSDEEYFEEPSPSQFYESNFNEAKRRKITMLDVVLSHSTFHAARPLKSPIVNSTIQSPLQVYLSSLTRSKEQLVDGYYSPSYDPSKEEEDARILEELDYQEHEEELGSLLPPSLENKDIRSKRRQFEMK